MQGAKFLFDEKLRETDPTAHTRSFNASRDWLQKFMIRNKFAIRRRTMISQKLPADLIPKLTDFVIFVRQLQLKNNYALTSIFACDETAIWLDMLPDTTVDSIGVKQLAVPTIAILSTICCCCNLVLAKDAKSRKLPVDKEMPNHENTTPKLYHFMTSPENVVFVWPENLVLLTSSYFLIAVILLLSFFVGYSFGDPFFGVSQGHRALTFPTMTPYRSLPLIVAEKREIKLRIWSTKGHLNQIITSQCILRNRTIYANAEVLFQRAEDGEKPIIQASRSLTKVERNYVITGKEVLAITRAVGYFHHYLYRQRVTIFMNQSVLRSIFLKLYPSSHITRWRLVVQESQEPSSKHHAGKNKSIDLLQYVDLLDQVVDEDWEEDQLGRPLTRNRKDPFQMYDNIQFKLRLSRADRFRRMS
uniref:Reverse transcriptase RNase H-like domain-containing protein n=1 Tax=Romanomermis culicivorax TaxID=13658 RepID=A0A915JYL3_ROMCU